MRERFLAFLLLWLNGLQFLNIRTTPEKVKNRTESVFSRSIDLRWRRETSTVSIVCWIIGRVGIPRGPKGRVNLRKPCHYRTLPLILQGDLGCPDFVGGAAGCCNRR